MKKFYTCKNELVFKNIFYNKPNESLLKKLIEQSLGKEIEFLASTRPLKINDYEFDEKELTVVLAQVNNKLTHILIYGGSYYDGCHNILLAYAMNKLNEINRIVYHLDTNNIIEINYIWDLPKEYDGVAKETYKFYDQKSKTVILDNFSIVEFNMDEIAKQENDESKKYKFLNILNFNQEQLNNLENPTEFDLKYKKAIEDLNNDSKFIEFIKKDH